MTSLTPETFRLALTRLAKLPIHIEEEEYNMLSITLSHDDSFTPELFQIYHNHDGSYSYSHLSHEGHFILDTGPVDLLNFILPFEIKSDQKIELLCGSDLIAL